jgi:hypothetical protein
VGNTTRLDWFWFGFGLDLIGFGLALVWIDDMMRHGHDIYDTTE